MKNSAIVLLLLGACAPATPQPPTIGSETLTVSPTFDIGSAGTPLVPVVPAPRSIFVPGPKLFDSTAVVGEPRDNAFPHQVVASGDWLFAATGQGIRVVNISAPDRPINTNYIDGSRLPPPAEWPASDLDFNMTYVDALPDDSAVIVAGAREAGFWVLDTRIKSLDRFHYQDTARLPFHVRIYRRGGTKMAAVATGHGIAIYNVDRAQTFASCVEDSAAAIGCPGVFLALLPRPAGTSGVPAIDVSASGTIAAVYQTRLFVYEPASGLRYRSPRAIALPLQGIAVAFFAAEFAVLGWETTSGVTYSRLLFFNGDSVASIADVTDRMNGRSAQSTLTVSSDGSNDYLYVGNVNSGVPGKDSCVDQREHLFTMRGGAPYDLAAAVADYWRWYYTECHEILPNGTYSPNPPGFNDINPMGAVMHRGRLYRALYRAADVHVFRPEYLPPMWTAEIFADGFETGDTAAWSAASGR